MFCHSELPGVETTGPKMLMNEKTFIGVFEKTLFDKLLFRDLLDVGPKPKEKCF